MSFKIADLQEGLQYYFRVLAENEYGIGEGKDTGEAVKVSEEPSAPQTLQV